MVEERGGGTKKMMKGMGTTHIPFGEALANAEAQLLQGLEYLVVGLR
jgi:hypothetical protein